MFPHMFCEISVLVINHFYWIIFLLLLLLVFFLYSGYKFFARHFYANIFSPAACPSVFFSNVLKSKILNINEVQFYHSILQYYILNISVAYSCI